MGRIFGGQSSGGSTSGGRIFGGGSSPNDLVSGFASVRQSMTKGQQTNIGGFTYTDQGNGTFKNNLGQTRTQQQLDAFKQIESGYQANKSIIDAQQSPLGIAKGVGMDLAGMAGQVGQGIVTLPAAMGQEIANQGQTVFKDLQSSYLSQKNGATVINPWSAKIMIDGYRQDLKDGKMTQAQFDTVSKQLNAEAARTVQAHADAKKATGVDPTASQGLGDFLNLGLNFVGTGGVAKFGAKKAAEIGAGGFKGIGRIFAKDAVAAADTAKAANTTQNDIWNMVTDVNGNKAPGAVADVAPMAKTTPRVTKIPVVEPTPQVGKIVDEGKVFYHGTSNKDLKSIADLKAGRSIGKSSTNMTYITENPEIAKNFGDNVISSRVYGKHLDISKLGNNAWDDIKVPKDFADYKTTNMLSERSKRVFEQQYLRGQGDNRIIDATPEIHEYLKSKGYSTVTVPRVGSDVNGARTETVLIDQNALKPKVAPQVGKTNPNRNWKLSNQVDEGNRTFSDAQHAVSKKMDEFRATNNGKPFTAAQKKELNVYIDQMDKGLNLTKEANTALSTPVAQVSKTNVVPQVIEQTTPKVAGSALKLQQETVSKGIASDLGDLATYQSGSYSVEAQKAVDLVNTDRKMAMDIATGKVPGDNPIHEIAVKNAIKDVAIQNSDAATLKQLASSPLQRQISESAQRLGAEGFTNGATLSDPVKAMQDLQTARIKAIAKNARTKPETLVTSTVDKIQKSVPKVTKNDWESFVRSLKC